MTGDDDGLLAEMIDVVMVTMADAFRELWDRPNGAAILEDWLDNRAVFAVSRDGIDVMVLPGREKP